MEIEKEIEISKHQGVVFFKDTPLGDLYDAFIKAWNLKRAPYEASIFYNLGRVHGIREERARRKKRATCSTGAAISEHGGRKGGSALPEEGDTSGSAPAESNEALVYRATTVQILNRIHSVNVLRKIYTMTKRLEECERTGY